MQHPANHRFNQALSLLPLPLHAIATNWWQAIRQQPGTVQALDALVLNEAGDRVLTSLPQVLAGSDYIGRSLARTPGLFASLVGPDSVLEPRSTGQIETHCAALRRHAADSQHIGTTLRVWRRAELVRIGWRDLAGWATLEEVVETLSTVADHAVSVALACAHYQVAQRHGEPIGSISGKPVRLVVLALGKLGGRELNFSSDIDLVLTYAEAGNTQSEKPISNHEFFIKVGQHLVSLLETFTEEGFVFRIDLRLRPNGASGPLALSFDAMDHYYTTHGRDWERYALIKTRALNLPGGHSDLLLEILRPFIYRKYLDFGAFDAIRDMKRMIEKALHTDDRLDDLKLGRGGIREIEFIVQSYQLIRGGREPQLQTYRLWQAMQALVELGIMEKPDAEALHLAYGFLRRTEHRLQMIDDQQTHQLPKDDLHRLRVASAMGYPDWTRFHTQLCTHTEAVHECFQKVFAPEPDADNETAELADLWLGHLERPSAERLLQRVGYMEPRRLLNLCQNLRGSAFYTAFSTSGRTRMDRLMPLAIQACAQQSDQLTAFARLVGVIESIGRRAAYLSLLSENALALSQLVNLISQSSWIAHWSGRHPVMLDELLNPIGQEISHDRATLATELRRRMETAPANDLERAMDLLREFRHAQTLHIAAADSADLLSFESVSTALSSLAEATLEESMNVARHSLGRKVNLDSVDLGVIAYGKLGSQELGYNSDLDIVFLYQSDATNSAGTDTTPHHCGRVIQRLIHILTTRTAAGNLYQTDLQLRPSGRAGTVVSSLSAFESYQMAHAWTWEHQALVRARLVVGSPALRKAFEQVRRRILCQPRNPTELRDAVVSMRERIIRTRSTSTDDAFDFKLGRGGLVDIEFIVQFLMLRWAGEYPQLINSRRTQTILHMLITHHLLDPTLGATLSDIVERYLQMDNRFKLQEKLSQVCWSELTDERDAIANAWQKLIINSG